LLVLVNASSPFSSSFQQGRQMTMRQRLLKLRSPALIAAFAVSICACALSSDACVENPKAVPDLTPMFAIDHRGVLLLAASQG
jgi:hypothetical protein